VIYFHSVDVQLAQGIERILRGAKVIKINVTSEFSQRINRVAHGTMPRLEPQHFQALQLRAGLGVDRIGPAPIGFG
jgi:hypothetical protein